MGQDEDPLRHAFPGHEALRGFSPPMLEVVQTLLLYKSFFSSPWYSTLMALEPDPDARSALEKIRTETVAEAAGSGRAAAEWDALGISPEEAALLAAEVRRRLLEDMVRLKESSTEVYLSAAMRAPTEPVRQDLIDQAGLDRAHADSLRKVLGLHTVAHGLAAQREDHGDGVLGVHEGPFERGTLTRHLRRALEALRDSGHTPTRIVLSALAYRHLRDEAAAEMEGGKILGLPADVDFGWAGEGFGFATSERVSLAEILTAMHERERPDA